MAKQNIRKAAQKAFGEVIDQAWKAYSEAAAQAVKAYDEAIGK